MTDWPKCREPFRRCGVDGCPRPYFAAGYCNPHYKRKWQYGDPLGGAAFRDDIPGRLARYYVVRPDGCWEWVGARHRQGYGTTTVKGRTYLAHRAVYGALRGGLPPELDHLCRFKACVNPDHLEPVTHAENVRRHSLTVTACRYGHAYTEANTYRRKGGRRCRTCLVAQGRLAA